jgi:REP element-mobilizing transposase RayT
MARIARFARDEPVFFGDDDYELYRDLLASQCRRQGVACCAYCLMPNHVHLIPVPDTEQSPGRALGETHRRYTSVINARLRVTGQRNPEDGAIRDLVKCHRNHRNRLHRNRLHRNRRDRS